MRPSQSRLRGAASTLILQVASGQIASRKSSYAKIRRLPRCPVLSLADILGSLSAYATKKVPTLITLLVGTLRSDGTSQSRNETRPRKRTMQTNKLFEQEQLRLVQQFSFLENAGRASWVKSTFVRNPVTVPQRKGIT